MNPTKNPTLDEFATEVRDYIQDFAEINRLIVGRETSHRRVKYSVILAIDEWNNTPPVDNHSMENFPSRYILLNLTICHILRAVAIIKGRNRFSYSDGGFQVETEAQDDRYIRMIQLIKSEITPFIRNLKTSLNIAKGWGLGIGSDYGLINGWYGIT